MTDERMMAIVQQVHELTQQNAPESAGTAWLSFVEDIVWIARANPAMPTMTVIVKALEVNDIDIDALVPEGVPNEPYTTSSSTPS